ncbi:MAG TPA: hypothetical protein VGZ29_07580 [Terriglobia bacterium]|nr:hypothetical protein [Terriglobia bacterium]
MDRITTTIRREWLKEIAAGRKRVENRQIKPYWVRRLSRVQVPFLLRLINGMHPKAPEVTVIVEGIRTDEQSGNFELALGEVVEIKHWSVSEERPERAT